MNIFKKILQNIQINRIVNKESKRLFGTYIDNNKEGHCGSIACFSPIIPSKYFIDTDGELVGDVLGIRNKIYKKYDLLVEKYNLDNRIFSGENQVFIHVSTITLTEDDLERWGIKVIGGFVNSADIPDKYKITKENEN